ncbi:OmpA family protein [Rhizobium sp. L1K21]|uniref:OmpA family protein n=1 Tax=Rhizobium sp. L1K21 TaxID=2954933 RepID=UPI002092E365|nr:OmpA family protein [Rhizobium sp. L1K21]MCO6188216.1 OmpA family protein [Rhizobium sp. L1K21]
MKKKLVAATALPLICLYSASGMIAPAQANAFNAEIVIAQAEEPQCAEADADCQAKKQEAPPADAEQPAEEQPAPEAQQPSPPAEETPPPAPEPAPPEPEAAPTQQDQAPEAAPAPETQSAPAPEAPPAPEDEVKPKPAEPEPNQTQDAAPAPQEAPAPADAAEAGTEQTEPPAEEPPAPEGAEPVKKPEPAPAPAPDESTTDESAAPSDTQTPPAPERAAPEEPKEEPKEATEPAAAEPASEQPPKTEEEKLKAAEDPASAEGTVELPVENGAPILDSAKEAPPETTRAAPQPEETAPQPKTLIVPQSDAEAQQQTSTESAPEQKPEARSALRQEGTRLDRRPRYEEPEGRVIGEDGNRMIIDLGSGISIRFDDGDRIERDSRESYYERLPGGFTRQVVERRNGDTVVTVRNRWGDIVQRSRIRDGREYILYYDPDGYDPGRDDRDEFYDPGRDLPPMRLPVPLSDYIIDTSSSRDRDYEEFLAKPPVEQVERIYSLDEVRHSARVRDKVRRIDLDTITFATGSAEVSLSEAKSLRRVADAINDLLEKDPGETFLIEGHTDAVGSDRSNLVLSDKRAESVAEVLTQVFDVQPENLATQGYGERYLKVRTEGPEELNRRVTIRRVTPLVRPAGAKVVEQ